jgi:hypothetical protein
VFSCIVRDGHTIDGTDCDDDDPLSFPGANETCDGKDNDCDDIIDGESASGSVLTYPDSDGDSFGDPAIEVFSCIVRDGHTIDGTDCDDDDPLSFPGANETCDGQDNDCDDIIDEDALDALTWYRDADEDDYGSVDDTRAECTAPEGFVANDGDCDDVRSDIHPGTSEVCDDLDNNCDGIVDNDATDAVTYFIDYDSDGHGSDRFTIDRCAAPEGFVELSDDCDDTEWNIHPDAAEVCDGRDNDCDTIVDGPTALGSITWFTDADDDGFGDLGAPTTIACDRPPFTSPDASDCNDDSAAVYPGAPEICDDLDNNCNGAIDEETATDALTWYRDIDGDGYGETDDSAPSCTEPEGYTAEGGDCEPTVGEMHPGAEELCNERDDDCDGEVDEEAIDMDTFYIDYDGDDYGSDTYTIIACTPPEGYTEDPTDCDDFRSTVYPGAIEFCDGLDNDCDGETDEESAEDLLQWYADLDRDDYADESTMVWACEAAPDHIGLADALGWDCDDLNDEINPGAEERWYDGVDQNCDEESDFDADTDGFEVLDFADTGDPTATPGLDCDDEDDQVHPDAEEQWYDGVDQDCDEESDFDADLDGHDSVSFGGEDCDDADPSTYPGAPDNPDDDRVNDCDEAEPDDADGDGFASVESGGDDCDDSNSSIYPGADDPLGDGLDQNCDGVDGVATNDTGSIDTGELGPDDPGEDTSETDPDSSDTAGDGAIGRSVLPESKRCGCATKAAPSGFYLVIMCLGLARRRRSPID